MRLRWLGCEWINATKSMNNESMLELQVQNTSKNKEKREWKKEIHEQKQESNLFHNETIMI